MMTPLVSVLMTAYNREEYIAEAIESVLASSYSNFELIVVDDCSKDRTVDIARSYEKKDNRVKVYVNDVNLGDYPNRNKAASLATGEYIKYVDSDDVMFPSCLQKMMKSMTQFPEAGFGLCADIDEQSKLCTSPRETYLEHFAGQAHFGRSPGGSIIRKDAFDKVGGFSGMRQLGDFEFWLKIGAQYPMVKLPFQIYWVREHVGRESSLNDNKEKEKMRLQVVRKIFEEEKVPLDDNEKMKIIKSHNRSLYRRIVRRVSKYLKKPSIG